MTRIGMTIGALLFLIVSCCNTDKPVVTAYPLGIYSELHVKGFDENCDGDIDYWQHYNSFGEKVGKPIWVRRK